MNWLRAVEGINWAKPHLKLNILQVYDRRNNR